MTFRVGRWIVTFSVIPLWSKWRVDRYRIKKHGGDARGTGARAIRIYAGTLSVFLRERGW